MTEERRSTHKSRTTRKGRRLKPPSESSIGACSTERTIMDSSEVTYAKRTTNDARRKPEEGERHRRRKKTDAGVTGWNQKKNRKKRLWERNFSG
ncbi:unnamed protein product [Cochlearia groenlandica]